MIVTLYAMRGDTRSDDDIKQSVSMPVLPRTGEFVRFEGEWWRVSRINWNHTERYYDPEVVLRPKEIGE